MKLIDIIIKEGIFETAEAIFTGNECVKCKTNFSNGDKIYFFLGIDGEYVGGGECTKCKSFEGNGKILIKQFGQHNPIVTWVNPKNLVFNNK